MLQVCALFYECSNHLCCLGWARCGFDGETFSIIHPIREKVMHTAQKSQ